MVIFVKRQHAAKWRSVIYPFNRIKTMPVCQFSKQLCTLGLYLYIADIFYGQLKRSLLLRKEVFVKIGSSILHNREIHLLKNTCFTLLHQHFFKNEVSSRLLFYSPSNKTVKRGIQ